MANYHFLKHYLEIICLDQLFSKCGLQVKGDLQGQNCHNNTKMSFAFLTALKFAVIMQKQQWAKLLLVAPNCVSSRGILHIHMLAGRTNVSFTWERSWWSIKIVNFIKSAFLSIHLKIFYVMKWKISIKNSCCITVYTSVSRKPCTVSALRCELN